MGAIKRYFELWDGATRLDCVAWGAAHALCLAAIVCFMAASCSCSYSQRPQVGDVYVSYADNRKDKYAMAHGFPAEAISVFRIVGVSNGMAYYAVLSFPITNTGHYPFPYNQFGPTDNFRKYSQYLTLVKPNPKNP